jgi:formylmethanofuran dehydrogenase subunit E
LSIWDRAIDFHGHACCVLAIGYRAAMLAWEQLTPAAGGGHFSAVVETADCSTDAIQAVLQCTTGNRRLQVRERGKYVFTVARDGAALRLVLKSGVLAAPGADFMELMAAVANGAASQSERELFYTRQQPFMEQILKKPALDLFDCRLTSSHQPTLVLSLTPGPVKHAARMFMPDSRPSGTDASSAWIALPRSDRC